MRSFFRTPQSVIVLRFIIHCADQNDFNLRRLFVKLTLIAYLFFREKKKYAERIGRFDSDGTVRRHLTHRVYPGLVPVF